MPDREVQGIQWIAPPDNAIPRDEKSSLEFQCPMPGVQTLLLLICSNVFMTFAWYGHLKDMRAKPWLLAVLASWSIAFFEYLLQVPANRIGATIFTLPQLKIVQEIITLTVFVPFAVLYMRTPLTWNYLAAAACMMGAVYFIFRD